MGSEILLFVVGLTLLTFGADWLVRGAARVAEHFGVSPLVVGLTIVAFGTSAPEMVVSVLSSIRGQPDIAVGNVMGSTVANVGLIAGFGALLRPIEVHRRLLVRETPLLMFVLSIVMVLSLNDALGRVDGFALVTGFVVYLVFLLRWGRDERTFRPDVVPRSTEGEGEGAEVAQAPPPIPYTETASRAADDDPNVRDEKRPGRDLRISTLKLLIGIPLLVIGAAWLVESATAIARALEIPDVVIAATLIAVGTSLPELASTAAAALRGLGDIAIGNVIGSNVFNLGLVLGTAAIIRPLELAPEIVVRQVLPALIFCMLLIPLTLTRRRVDRLEGVFLLTSYAAYIVWIL